MFPTQVFLDGALYRDRAARANVAHRQIPDDRAAEIPLAVYWERDDVPRFVPATVALTPVAEVRVQHAAWIVVCPLCGVGAQYAAPTDPRYFCLACLNEAVDGQWLAVEWPKQRAAIEAALRPRQTINANWLPGESVADLHAENRAHGLEVNV